MEALTAELAQHGLRIVFTNVLLQQIGVPIPAGTHLVVFKYRPRSSYPALFALGVFVLLAIALGPLLWRRWSARRKSRTPIPG